MKKLLVFLATVLALSMSVSAQNTNVQDLSGRHADYYYLEPWLWDSTITTTSLYPSLGHVAWEGAPDSLFGWEAVHIYNTQIPLPLKGIAIVGNPRSTGPLADCALNLYSYDYVMDERVLLSTATFNPHDSVGLYGINILNSMWGGPTYIDRTYLNLYEAMFDSTVIVDGPFLVGYPAHDYRYLLATYTLGGYNYQGFDEDSLHTLGRVYSNFYDVFLPGSSVDWEFMSDPLWFPIIDTTGFTMPAVDSCKKPENIQMREIVGRSIDEYPPLEDLPPYRDTTDTKYLEISWTPAPESTATAVYCEWWHADTLKENGIYGKAFSKVWVSVEEDWTIKYHLRSLGSRMGCSCSASDSTEKIDYYWGMLADTRDTITGFRYWYDTTQTDPVRIDEPQQENPLAELTYVMPNPASGQVTIASSFGLRSVDIYSMTGTLVMRQDLSGYAQQMDISALPSDTYLLVISTPAGQVTKKLLVQ